MADSQRKTANLFDSSKPIQEIYVTDTAQRYGWIIGLPQGTYTVYTGSTKIFCKYKTASEYGTAYGTASPVTLTIPQNAYILIYVAATSDLEGYDIMLNAGSTVLPYEPYGWVHSLRKLTTATEAVENPLYSDGTAITAYTLKGNTVQNGTPTPSNPVDVNGVGDKTEQLFNAEGVSTNSGYVSGYYLMPNGNLSTYSANWAISEYIEIDSNTNYVITNIIGNTPSHCWYNADKELISSFSAESAANFINKLVTSPNNAKYLRISYVQDVNSASYNRFIIDVIKGSTVPSSYIPYGYKIPISNGQQTTNIYLGSTPLDKNGTEVDTIGNNTLYKATNRAVLTGLENWTLQSINQYGIANFYLANVLTGLDVAKDILCSHGERQTTGISQTTTEGFIANNNGEIYFRINSTTASTVPEFKAWLSEQNPQVTFLYTLATPTSTTVTPPSIPTTEGANSITVDTTVQPSEFTATWTGWHDAEVKEKSENYLDENDFGLVEVAAGTYRVGTDVGVLPSGKYTFNAVKSSSAVQIYRTTKNGSTYNYETITNLPYTFAADGVSNQIFRSAGNTGSSWADLGYTNVMLNTGETAQTYEPYWK